MNYGSSTSAQAAPSTVPPIHNNLDALERTISDLENALSELASATTPYRLSDPPEIAKPETPQPRDLASPVRDRIRNAQERLVSLVAATRRMCSRLE